MILGVIGMLGLGTGEVVHQPYSMATDFKGVVSTIAVAFWLFIGAEYVIPVSKNVKNARRNVPLGMMIGLALICLVQSVMVLGFHNYTPGRNWKIPLHHTCFMVEIFLAMREKCG